MKREKLFYSDEYPQLFDEKERERIAKQLFAVLSLKVKNPEGKSCLDVACSAGIIANYLSKYFKKIVGIDVDKKALSVARIRFKRKNLRFVYMDAEKMGFKGGSFDVVVCNQVYQFVNHPGIMIAEIARVMKPSGILIITGPNLLSFFEAQTKLPLIHFFPDFLSVKIAKMMNRQYHPARYETIFGLRTLLKNFRVLNATPLVIKHPSAFGFENLAKFEGITSRIPVPILNLLSFFSPNFILVCEKDNVV